MWAVDDYNACIFTRGVGRQKVLQSYTGRLISQGKWKQESDVRKNEMLCLHVPLSLRVYCEEGALQCVRVHRCQIRGRTQLNSPSSSRLCSAEHNLLAWSCLGNLEPGMTPKNSRDYLQSVMMHTQIGSTKRSRSM